MNVLSHSFARVHTDEHYSDDCHYHWHSLGYLGLGCGQLGAYQLGGFSWLHRVFRLPARGLRGLLITLLTCMSGVFWAMMIIQGSALQPEWTILGYMLTGIVAFLMCIQACQQWLSFVPGTFIGACATFAGNGDWKLVVASLLVGAVFGYAMKNSGLWLAARRSRPGKEASLSPSADTK